MGWETSSWMDKRFHGGRRCGKVRTQSESLPQPYPHIKRRARATFPAGILEPKRGDLPAPITPLPMSSLFIPISQNRSRLHATHIILNTSSVLLRRWYVRCDVAHNLQLSNWPNTAARKKTWVAWILGERARVREKDVQVRLTLYHSFSTKCVLTSLDRKWQWVLSDEQCIKLQRDKWNDGGGVNYNCLSISHSYGNRMTRSPPTYM